MADEEIKVESKKPPVVLIALIGALVMVLIIGAIVIIMLMGGSAEDPNATQDHGAPAAQTQQAVAAPKQRSQDFFNIGMIQTLDTFVVNLLSESGSRFLKASMNLELSEEALAPEIEKKIPLIRDIVIRTLSSKTYEDVSTTKGKEQLKDELVTRINEVLRDGYVKNVFFTDFIVQ